MVKILHYIFHRKKMNYKICCTNIQSCDIKAIFLLLILCHLHRYNFKSYQYILALLFAIEEINGNPNLLPNISLGFDFYNVRFTEKDTLMNVCMWLTAHREKFILPNYNCEKKYFTAALTGTSWTISAQIGTLFQLFKFPQVRKGILWQLEIGSSLLIL
jgi:hypothetical protein